MGKYEVVVNKNPVGYYLVIVDKKRTVAGFKRFDCDKDAARMIGMDISTYRNILTREFSGFRGKRDVFFKTESDCEAAAEWLESKLNEGENNMDKQGLVLKGNEKKRLTFGDLEPGGLFIEEGCDTICRKISTETSTPGLSTSSKIYDGFYVIESGDLVGSVCHSYNNLTVRRMKLVNNECVYV